jgi:hypothetical protein
MKLDKKLINILKSWAKKMHKEEKRKFQAEVTNEYLWWSSRKAETIFYPQGAPRDGIQELLNYE